jgi:hypothetical protein
MGLIHEFGHILFCIISGGTPLKLGASDEYFGVMHVTSYYPNQTSRLIGCIGGSLFECSIALILCRIIWKKRKGIKFFFGIGCSFPFQCLYWGLSPIIQYGDGYNFCIITNTPFILISLIGLTSSVIAFILLYYYHFQIFEFNGN